MNLELPPLRKRGNDILELFNHFLDLYSDEYGYNSPEINAVEAAQLLQASWPGNVRQLINLAEKAVLHHKKRPDSLSKLLFQEIILKLSQFAKHVVYRPYRLQLFVWFVQKTQYLESHLQLVLCFDPKVS